MKPLSPDDGDSLTVAQFAKLVGASRSQLLFYDKHGFFTPAFYKPSGEQASNRRYKLDQVFSYRMLWFFRHLGCTLEESSRIVNAGLDTRAAFLKAQELRLRQEMQRLETVQECMSLMIRFQQLAETASTNAPAFIELPEDYHCIYHRFDPPCLRNTARFAQLYIRHLEENKSDPDILPAPTVLTFSMKITEDGRFPVTGILSLYRHGTGAEKSNYILAAGRYAVCSVLERIGSMNAALLRGRQFLLENRLQRTTPVMCCDMGVQQMGDQGMLFNECIFYSVQPGHTPANQMPALPDVF